MEKKRIFVAINLPKEVKNKLLELQKEIKNEFENLTDIDFQRIIRFVPPENLHLTLLFLGYLSFEQIEALKRILKEIAPKQNSFKIVLKSLSYAPPDQKIPRMIWVKISQSQELLLLQENLQKSVRDAFEFRFFKPEKRPFLPHLTLARLKLFGLKKLDELPAIEKNLNFDFQATSFEIMESNLKRTGAQYSIIESFKFQK